MSLINSTAIPSGASAYEIDQSLRFEDGSSAYLSRTPSSAGNRKTWTWSGWVKRGNLGGPQLVLFAHSGNNNTDYGGIIINSDVFEFTCYSAAACTTPSLMRDTSSWYHLMCVMDTTQATQADRIKLYRNGELLTKTIAAAYPAQNANMPINAATGHSISGRNPFGGSQYFDGYLSEVNFVDGQALTPSDFGETGTYGEWKPIEYSGSYGTNGFFLNFATAADMGDDKSGNTNDWAENNIAASDQMLDSPTNNFPTWNPIGSPAHAELSYSEGNLKVAHSNTNDNTTAVASMELPSSGKWYWEVQPTADGDFYLGVGRDWVTNQNDTSILVSEIGWAMRNNGTKYTFNVGAAYGGSYGDGDIVGIAVDVDNSKIWFGINNDFNSQGGGNPSNGSGAAYTNVTGDNLSIHASEGAGTVAGFIANFGQDSSFAGTKTAQGNQDANGIGDFYYAPASGFLALCTSNLPDVAVVPSEHFNTVLYTGTGSSNAITGVGFQPDFAWIKDRTNAYQHQAFDAVRGVTKKLHQSTTAAEATDTTSLTAFGADGFTVSTNAGLNTNTASYVAWNWKANGSGSSNTNGSINTTKTSANVDAGFSIISYNGNDTAGATIGHGLSKKPELIIFKNRVNSQGASDWDSYVSFLGATKFISLNIINNGGTSATRFNNTEPTATLITLGASYHTNYDKIIAYAFHSVDGYSKVGTYTGNGNADGTFVHTGFAVQWVLIKKTSGDGNWAILDAKRNTYNPAQKMIRAEGNDAEANSSNSFTTDFLSNGFKCRATNGYFNASGGTYIYLAFAETPFKYSNAR